MSNKKLTILGVVAVFMVLWAVVQSRVSNRPAAEQDALVYLIQGLEPSGIGGIALGAGEDAVTLKRQENGFVVVNKDNYPAKTSEINDLISKCLDIQTSEFVTDNPGNHEDLEVTEDKARTVIKFMTPEPNSTILAGVVVGKTKELGQGTYVRLLSKDSAVSNKVYVASDVPWFSTGVMSYVEQELISAKRDDIESVVVTSADGAYTLKTAEGGTDIVMENVPPGKKLKSSDAQSVFTALTSLSCDDVRKKSSDLAFDKQYVCKLKDSTVYTLKIAQKDDKTYITSTSDFMDTTPVTKGSDVETEEELKAKEAKLLARDKAEEFTKAHQGWVYEIADWKAKNLTKGLSDLLEDEEKPKEEGSETPITVMPDLTAAPLFEDPNTVPAEDPNTAKAEP
ncbi:MAG: DUF4340 domain-containing protein [Planctomycetota bacterium]